MYDSHKDFSQEILSIWGDIKTQKPFWYKKNLDNDSIIEAEILDAWLLYENARNSSLREMLLGDVGLRSDLPVLNNFGVTTGSKSAIELGTVYKDKYALKVDDILESVTQSRDKNLSQEDVRKHLQNGSILNDGSWWPFKNDAWVLGAVHGLKIFHLGMQTIPNKLLWDGGANRPRVLGRELIGLAAFGYKRVIHLAKDKKTELQMARQLVGMVWGPTSRDDAEGATFTEYYKQLAAITNYGKLQSFALGNTIGYGQYDYAKL